MISCTRRLTFSAGHRVCGHESKCARLHGHNFVVEITAVAPELDSLGRVVDFSVLKQRCGEYLEKWDHHFLWFRDDPSLVHDAHGSAVILPMNPTAENLARFLGVVFNLMMLDVGIRIVRVRVYETENCWADASPSHFPATVAPDANGIALAIRHFEQKGWE